MLLAPPAEGSNPSLRDSPTADVRSDDAPAPGPNDSVPFDDGSGTSEPSLLNAPAKKRPIRAAKDEQSAAPTLTAADLDEAEAAADKAGTRWSVWPPIVAAAVGLLALIGFSFSLRRRTLSTKPTSQVEIAQPQPANRNPQPGPRRDLLDAIIDNQLPLTEEQVPFTSPMQFHGRPQPPKTIRMDQRHTLPKPHSPNTVGIGVSNSEFRAASSKVAGTPSQLPSAQGRSAATATQKIRIDRSSTTDAGSKLVSGVPAKSSASQPVSGTLDRALSAVQKREERGA
jgi:hypothetical protein